MRIGILGAAKIAGMFMIGAKQTTRVQVVAIGSRDRGRAEEFARIHGIPRSCSYEELLADRTIDAIYNPLPNSLHADWSIRALRAGKHVLCEKPLAMTEAEAEAMFEAADANRVELVEAFPYMFQPQTLAVEQLVKSGAIGDVRLVFATFGFTVSDPANIRLDAALGGGALMDAGCYPVSFARQIIGKRPERIHKVARYAYGVDQTLAATLEYPGGAIAQVSCSFATAVQRSAAIQGSTGIIETGYANHTNRFAHPSYRIKRSTAWDVDFETIPVPAEDGFKLEIEAFAHILAHDDRPQLAQRRAASLDNAWTLEQLRV